MRQSTSGNITTSVLGFGCGSVMGRIGRGASLRAMHTAWDQGITLYDTARSYGYGEAEAVLGDFLRGKRDRAIIATKFGIAPQTQSALKRALLPLMRVALKVSSPGVKQRLRGSGAAAKPVGSFSVQGLQISLEQSLRALQTDYVDLLFLHEATTQTVHDEELVRALEAQVRAGKVRRVGLYADGAVIAEAMQGAAATFSAMQFGANPFSLDPFRTGPLSGGAAPVARDTPNDVLLIGNHPFGSQRRMARIETALAAIGAEQDISATLREKLQDSGRQALLEAVLGVALDGMGNHALVFSMMHPEHIRANVQAIEGNRFSTEELRFLRGRLLNAARG